MTVYTATMAPSAVKLCTASNAQKSDEY